MRKNFISLVFPLIAFLTFTNYCFTREISKIKILATTSLIKTIVMNIGHEKINVVSITPSGMCPGHFDLKPQHVQLAASSDILFFHGWETWINELKNSIENKNLKLISLETKGNLMVPDNYLRAIEKVANVLCKMAPKSSKYFQNNAHIYKKQIKVRISRSKKKTEFIKDIPVLCSQYQAEFLKWIGLKIIATYGRSEELTIKQLIKLIKIGKENHVKAVIDNLQSGEKAGLRIAEEIGCKHITLTNFPLNDSYLETLEHNVEKILEIIK